MKTMASAAAVLVLALGALPSAANEKITCKQLGLKEVVVNIRKFFHEKHWGLTGNVIKSDVSYMKKGEYVGIAAQKKHIYAVNANGVEYQNWEDVGREKTVSVCGVPVPPKFFRTADCEDITGDPIADCRNGDPWQMWGIVFRGGGGGGESPAASPDGGGQTAGGDAPVCSDRAYCTGSGFKRLQEFTIESVNGTTLAVRSDLCACPGRCGEVRRWASGLAEFIGDAVTVNTDSVAVDKGNIPRYTAPRPGETAYLVWKPCGS